MVGTVNELRNAITNAKVIKKEITDTLLELDTLPSVGTQADLNDMLVELYDRIKSNEEITFEIFNKVITTEEYIRWIENEFTTYSSKLFIGTINEEG